MKYVAFLDILGFKDLVLNNEHGRLIALYEIVFADTVDVALANGKIIIKKEENKLLYTPDRSKILVNSIIVSDSVILWTDDCSVKSLIDILISTKYLLNHSFVMGFPLRGAMSKGEFSAFTRNNMSCKNNSINTYLGRALVEAYQLESQQNWSGFIIEEKDLVPEEVVDFNLLQCLINNNLICNYPIPFKEKMEGNYFSINWLDSNIFKKNTNDLKGCFEQYEKSSDNDKAQEIIRNTLDFINEFSEK
ncbi:MAG TPA: hypothetical protein VKY32_06515 [Flavobacterium sp.]|nr:hypothetical protein [Flavobacterium sp.]